MSKKGGNFFEEHIEKMVLAVVGILCIWLLITRVLISPNKVLYDHKKLSPGEIDVAVRKQAGSLQNILERPATPMPPLDPCFPSFAGLFESPVSVDANLVLHLPPNISLEVSTDRKYRIPSIAEVTDLSVEHIRVVAYVPVADVDHENPYEEAGSEANDIDLVTVEAKFDVAGLYKSFHESFAGEDVPEEWRDPCLAKPIFAAVELQRKRLLADGSWSEWQTVPRTRIETRREMFEVIEDVGELPPGGMKVRWLQFDDPIVRGDLLQPEAYRIASADEEWFPPSLHREYADYQEKVRAEEKREAAAAAEKEEKGLRRDEELRGRPRGNYAMREEGGMRDRVPGMRDRGPYSDRRVRGAGPRTRNRGAGGYDRARMPGWGDYDESERDEMRYAKSKETQKTPSIKDFYAELREILIARKDISKMREPLVFWAHDDTVEPENSYRYRIRLGVLNPIAGTNQLSKRDESLKNKVILWSKFSDVTKTVEIPGTLYFFPYEVQEDTKIVTVKVFRYALGYWRSKDFRVKQGEVVGKVDYEPEAEETGEAREQITVPDAIDYGTGIVLVDVIRVNEWSGWSGKRLHPRYYSDMLYSFDGTSIEHMPIKRSNWPKALEIEYRELDKAKKEPKKAWRSWGSRPEQRKLYAPRLGDEEYDEFEEEERWRDAIEMDAFRRR